MKKTIVAILLFLLLSGCLFAIAKERTSLNLGAIFYGDNQINMDKGNLGPYLGVASMDYVGGFFKFGFGTNFDVSPIFMEAKTDQFDILMNLDFKLDLAMDFGSFMSLVFGVGGGFGDMMAFQREPFNMANAFGIDIIGTLDLQFGFGNVFGLSLGATYHMLMPLYGNIREDAAFLVDTWPNTFMYSLTPRIGFIFLD